MTEQDWQAMKEWLAGQKTESPAGCLTHWAPDLGPAPSVPSIAAGEGYDGVLPSLPESGVRAACGGPWGSIACARAAGAAEGARTERERIRQGDPAIMALTVRQPWAWAICHGKPVENRTWQTGYRGLLAIHTGGRARWDPDGQRSRAVREAWLTEYQDLENRDLPALTKDTTLMPFSAIVAVALLTDVHLDADCTDVTERARLKLCSHWAAFDSWHWCLTSVTALAEPVPATGRLGLWRLPPDIEEAVRHQLGGCQPEVAHRRKLREGSQ